MLKPIQETGQEKRSTSNKANKENVKPRRNANFILKNKNGKKKTSRSKDKKPSFVNTGRDHLALPQSLRIRKKKPVALGNLTLNPRKQRDVASLRIRRKKPSNGHIPYLQNKASVNLGTKDKSKKKGRGHKRNRSMEGNWDNFVREEYKLEKLRV